MPETTKVKLDQSVFDDAYRVKLSGLRYTAIAGCAVMGTLLLGGVVTQLQQANELKKQEIQLKQRELDLRARQHTLDSLRFEYLQKNMSSRQK